MKKLLPFAVVIGVATLVSLTLRGPATTAQEKAAPQATKWEYKLVQQTSEAYWNKLGEEGWEMVGLSFSTQPPFSPHMAFKRPKR